MLLHSIISQSNNVVLENQPEITWEGDTSGDYQNLTGLNQTKVTIWSPTGSGDRAYNHHAHCFEYYGHLHVCYSTANDDEEEPGQYVRYQKSTDGGATWSTPQVLLESQDDITKGWTVAGRVAIPSCFVITEGKLYAVVDINDKGASNSSRTGVGVLAIKINSNATFSTPKWIENVDGTTNAPSAVGGYPSYSFDNTLRTKIRNYLLIPKNLPTWYYSVPSSDPLFSRNTFGGNAVSEPSAVRLPNSQILKLWRLLVGGSDTKIAQVSNDNGATFEDLYDTGIPDQPSRTKLLQLNSTTEVGVIGNNDSTNRSPLFFALSEDGLTYKASNIYNIDTETTGAVYSGVYKDTGVQYPDAVQLQNGKIFTAYSVNKEDIRISIFDKPTAV